MHVMFSYKPLCVPLSLKDLQVKYAIFWWLLEKLLDKNLLAECMLNKSYIM